MEKIIEALKKGKPKPPKSEGYYRCGADVVKKSVLWLWPGWIPLSKLTVLDGDPGLGKSTVLLDLAARVSKCGLMPDGSQGMEGNVCVMSAEDGVEDTIAPRLEAASANPNRVFFLEEVDDWDSPEPNARRPYEFPEDCGRLEEFLLEKEIRLLIIDPLIAFIVGADVNKDQQVRRVLHKLSKIADRTKTAIIGMRHLNKTSGTNPLYRGNMSIGVIGHARTGLLIAENPDNSEQRVLAVSKCNLGKKPKGLVYSLEESSLVEGYCFVEWHGEYDGDTYKLLEPNSEEKKEFKSLVSECSKFIQEKLEGAGGTLPAKKVIEDCQEALGVNERLARRAFNKIPGSQKPLKTKQGWVWTISHPVATAP